MRLPEPNSASMKTLLPRARCSLVDPWYNVPHPAAPLAQRISTYVMLCTADDALLVLVGRGSYLVFVRRPKVALITLGDSCHEPRSPTQVGNTRLRRPSTANVPRARAQRRAAKYRLLHVMRPLNVGKRSKRKENVFLRLASGEAQVRVRRRQL